MPPNGYYRDIRKFSKFKLLKSRKSQKSSKSVISVGIQVIDSCRVSSAGVLSNLGVRNGPYSWKPLKLRFIKSERCVPWPCTRGSAGPAGAARCHTSCHTCSTWRSPGGSPPATGAASISSERQTAQCSGK